MFKIEKSLVSILVLFSIYIIKYVNIIQFHFIAYLLHYTKFLNIKFITIHSNLYFNFFPSYFFIEINIKICSIKIIWFSFVDSK